MTVDSVRSCGHLPDQSAICGAQSSDQREELKATSIETLRPMVAAGVGCTLLPRLASLPGTGSLRGDTVLMRPFAEPLPTRTIGLAWRRNFPRESTIRTVGASISSQLPPEVERLGDAGGAATPEAPAAVVRSRRTEALSVQSL